MLAGGFAAAKRAARASARIEALRDGSPFLDVGKTSGDCDRRVRRGEAERSRHARSPERGRGPFVYAATVRLETNVVSLFRVQLIWDISVASFPSIPS